jgi:hypothetical protein
MHRRAAVAIEAERARGGGAFARGFGRLECARGFFEIAVFEEGRAGVRFSLGVASGDGLHQLGGDELTRARVRRVDQTLVVALARE